MRPGAGGHNAMGGENMLTIFVRTLILYVVSVLAMRLMGKRQVGQLQPYEFVLALMIAELAASPMENVGTPLLYGIVPILGLLFLHGLGTLLSVKFTPVRRAISGGPSVIIRKGAIQFAEMRRMCYTTTDLLEELRAQGFLNIADVCTAVLETSGKLSVFPYANKRPATPEDLQLQVDYEGIPMTLVVDGRVQAEHLKKCGLTAGWLLNRLRPLGYERVESVLLASLDTQGRLFVQGKGEQGKMHLVQALEKKAAGW